MFVNRDHSIYDDFRRFDSFDINKEINFGENDTIFHRVSAGITTDEVFQADVMAERMHENGPVPRAIYNCFSNNKKHRENIDLWCKL